MMNNSFRWYSIKRANRPLSARSLVDSMMKVSTQEAWFVGSRDAKTHKFYRKIQLVVPEFHADGEEGFRTIDSLSAVEFAIVEVEAKTLLRVHNPGRNMQALMSSFERAVGRGFSAHPLTFSDRPPLSILARADVKRIVGVKLINVAITNDCVGRMEFASKSGIDLSEISLLRNLKYKVDHVKYEIVVNGERGAFSFASNGLIKVGGALTPLIVHELQRDLASQD
jgi:hypothetical protein